MILDVLVSFMIHFQILGVLVSFMIHFQILDMLVSFQLFNLHFSGMLSQSADKNRIGIG